MLTLYKARTVREGADRVLSEIKSYAGRNVVIVPDPFTLAVEREVSEKLGAQGVFGVEVMSFSRLAAVTLGKKIRKCLSPAGSVTLMEKVVRARESELRHYRRAARQAGFAAEVYAAITSLRNGGVSAEMLFEAADKLTGYVADKTRDVALLYDAYLQELNLNHTDSTTRLEALVAEIEASAPFGDVHFHIVDHVDLNRKQLEVVAALVKKASSVSVAVAVGEGADNKGIYPPLYKNLVREVGASYIKEVEVPFALTGARAHIAEELFSYSYTLGEHPSLTLAEGKDMTEEVTYLATEITRLVRREGLRYSDVAIITPSFSEYLPYLERIFHRYEIPFFADARYPLSGCDFFRHVLRALEIREKDFEQSVVRAYVTHPLFTGATKEEKAAFCDYLDKTGLNRKRLLEPFKLYGEDPLLGAAEKVRLALAEELREIAALPKSAPMRLYCDAIKSYLERNGYEERLAEYVKKVDEANLKKHAEILRRTAGALLDLLDTLADLRGEEEVTCEEFLLALQSGAGQVKLAALPVRLDSVYFAAVEQAMYAPIRALFVIGAEEGLFPLEKVKEGILGPVEYAAWQGCGMDIREENPREAELTASRFHALQLLLRAEELTLSYLGGRTPSSCVVQLSRMFGVQATSCAERLKRYDVDLLIPTRAVAESTLVLYSGKHREGLIDPREERIGAALSQLLGKPFPLPCDEEKTGKIPEKIAGEIFFRKGTMSASEIESYFHCPFKHFVTYGLAAKEKRFADKDKRDEGNLAHDCMERFVKYHVVRRPKGDISDDEAREIAATLARQRVAEDPRFQAIGEKEGERALAEAIARCGEIAVLVKNQIYHSSFTPTLFERWFGGEDKGGLAAISPEGIRFTGRMDRVDVLPAGEGEKPYAVAIDYKTGDHKAEPDKIYAGVKVQLPLYLEVLAASGYTPVAALYASLKTRKGSDPYLYGPKRGDKEMMTMLDESLGREKSPYTGLSLDKAGEVKESMLVSDEVFDAIRRYVLLLTEQAIREIRSGAVYPSSLKTGQDPLCKSCEMKNICRHGGENVRLLPKGFKAEAFPEIVGKEGE